MPNEIIIREPDPGDHEAAGTARVQEANAAVIACNEDRELVGIVLAELRSKIALIEKEFDGTDDMPGPVSLAYKTWKSGVALRDKCLTGFKEAVDIWNRKVRRFEYDVEQKRLAEARRLEDQARKKAEEERQRQIDEARRLGDLEAVTNLKEAPITVVAPPPKTPEVTKADGVRRSSPDWDFEVTNYEKIPCKWHMLHEKAVRALVKRLGPKHGIPGITVFDRRART